MSDELAEALEGRHPATREVAQFFTFNHLPMGRIRGASVTCHDLAVSMLLTAPDSPELTTGLRKLLEAKDCFVRCQVARTDVETVAETVAEARLRRDIESGN
jgi:hypothetical protein